MTLSSSLRVGVDLVDVGQVAVMLQGDAEFQRLSWTEAELIECNGSPERLAARWAVKEAVMKALGHGIGEIDPTDIEVLGVPGSAPEVRLHSAARDIASELGLDQWSISMSHEAGLAVAFVAAIAEHPRSVAGEPTSEKG